MKAGRPPATSRPDMGGLMVVLTALHKLHGERHAPELPVPHSAIEAYAQRLGFSRFFVHLVQVYDGTLMSRHRDKMKAKTK